MGLGIFCVGVRRKRDLRLADVLVLIEPSDTRLIYFQESVALREGSRPPGISLIRLVL